MTSSQEPVAHESTTSVDLSEMAEHGSVGPEREGRRSIQVYMAFTRTVTMSKHGDITTPTKGVTCVCVRINIKNNNERTRPCPSDHDTGL